MAIPDYQDIMLPILTITADGREHRLRDVADALCDVFQLTESERAQILPSGRQKTILNRTGWAKTFLYKAGLLESPKRGVLRISDLGRKVLASRPERIDNTYLEQFNDFLRFRDASRRSTSRNEVVPSATEGKESTPEELLEVAYQQLRSELADTLLRELKAASPSFFERVVLELLVAMGYGGSFKDAAATVGASHDGGIDGIIKEDRLGLDIIYLQAKRWEGTVGRPEVQRFAGALQGRRARKGVFITTSSFSSEAISFAQGLDSKVILIDGQQLCEFMIDHNLGVDTVATYAVKRIDSDFFSEE